MGKLKTAKGVQEEIIRKYFTMEEILGGGALFREINKPKSLPYVNINDCLESLRRNHEILAEIVNNYFESLENGGFNDKIGNAYKTSIDCLNSIIDGSYNSRKIEETKKNIRRRNRYG